MDMRNNGVTKFFKESARHIVEHPQSAIRGLSAAVAIGGALASLNGKTNPHVSPAEWQPVINYLFNSAIGLGAGLLTYRMHYKGEELNTLRQQAYPEQKIRNLFNNVSRYAVTGLHVITGAFGAAAVATKTLPPETTQIIADQMQLAQNNLPNAFRTFAIAGSSLLLTAKAGSKGAKLLNPGAKFDDTKIFEAKKVIERKKNLPQVA